MHIIRQKLDCNPISRFDLRTYGQVLCYNVNIRETARN